MHDAGKLLHQDPRQGDVRRALHIKKEKRFAEIEHFSECDTWKFPKSFDGAGVAEEGRSDASKRRSLFRPDGTLRAGGNGNGPGDYRPGSVQSRLYGRYQWQDQFDSTIKRLMVDFDLSEESGCKLNHLDRFHGWFRDHGQKSADKAKEGPSYLTVSKNEPLPAGSSRNHKAPLSNTSMILARSMRMRKSPRLDVPVITPPKHSSAPPAAGVAPNSAR